MTTLQHEQIENKSAESARLFREALLHARQKFGPIHKDAVNTFAGSRYATLGTVLEAVLEPLAAEGFLIFQSAIQVADGWALQTRLVHVAGHEEVGLIPLILVNGEKANAMSMCGSAVSLARRYGLLAILCLVAEDDDAATAGAVGHSVRVEAPKRDERRGAEGPMGTPKTGKALFAWVKEREADGVDGLFKRVNDYAKRAGIEGRIVDWSETEVQAVFAKVSSSLEKEWLRSR